MTTPFTAIARRFRTGSGGGRGAFSLGTALLEVPGSAAGGAAAACPGTESVGAAEAGPVSSDSPTDRASGGAADETEPGRAGPPAVAAGVGSRFRARGPRQPPGPRGTGNRFFTLAANPIPHRPVSPDGVRELKLTRGSQSRNLPRAKRAPTSALPGATYNRFIMVPPYATGGCFARV